MKNLRVAQVGTFDLDNLGDLLFPIVFAKLLRRLESELQIKIDCDLFGLKGAAGATIYPDQLGCHPIALFEKMDCDAPYDLIFIGGGDIIRDDDDALMEIYGTVSSHFSYPQLLSPSNANQRKLVLLAPGAPFPLSKPCEIFLRNSFQRTIYASARDAITAKLLGELVPPGIKVDIVPDIVNALSSTLPIADLEKNIQSTLPGQYLQDGYICFQVRLNFLSDYLEIGQYLLDLQQKTGYRIVLLEIGRCLGDDGILRKLSENFDFLYVRNDRPSTNAAVSILDKIAVIAASKAFIGTSLHGNIIANSYNIPHFTFGNSKLTKINGFFSAEKAQYIYASLPDLFARISETRDLIYAGKSAPTDEERVETKKVYSFIRDCFHTLLNSSRSSSTYLPAINELFLLSNQYRLNQKDTIEKSVLDLSKQADHNAILEQELGECKEHLRALDTSLLARNQQINALQQEITSILTSNSWHVTKPLRFLRRSLG